MVLHFINGQSYMNHFRSGVFWRRTEVQLTLFWVLSGETVLIVIGLYILLDSRVLTTTWSSWRTKHWLFHIGKIHWWPVSVFFVILLVVWSINDTLSLFLWCLGRGYSRYIFEDMSICMDLSIWIFFLLTYQ